MATILIVDDRPINREFLVTLLGYRGHRLPEAADGAEALAVARAERPDLIITDILMPTMDGYEFARQLRADPLLHHTPVIFYTAHYLDSEARALAQACGVSSIITKPADPEVILSAVDALLAGAPVAEPPPPLAEFDREHLRVITDKLSQKVEEWRAVSERLTTFIEFNQELAAERDPMRLLNGFCSAARKLVGAKFAAVGMYDRPGRQLRYFLTSGMDAETTARLGSPLIGIGALATLSMECRTLRQAAAGGSMEAVGLPPNYPEASSLLAASIVSLKKFYGWLCLTGKVGAAEFSPQDERLVAILGAQVGRIFENGSLYIELEQRTTAVEREARVRVRTEEELRTLNVNLEQRVRERTTQLELANRELESFSYSVSHDLRAPLRAIDGFSNALLEDYGAQLDRTGRGLLERVRRSTTRMGQLIDDLLNLARVARAELQPQSVDLSDLAQAIVGDLAKTQPQRSVECIIAAGLVVEGDARLLRVALENLLGNAWKYSSRQPHARIEFGAMQHQLDTAYFVRDNGAGFDMVYADKLFGAFQRLHSEAEFEGTGIGLATVQRIIQRHGGHIWAEAVLGEGATFYFTLPPAPRG